METLTKFGPGKFSHLVDKVLYELSMDGCDEEAGDAQSTGWYGLLRGLLTIDGPMADVVPQYALRLSAADREYLTTGVGFIVTEDDCGFFDAERFTDADELKSTWDRIVAADVEAHSCRHCGTGRTDDEGTCTDCERGN